MLGAPLDFKDADEVVDYICGLDCELVYLTDYTPEKVSWWPNSTRHRLEVCNNDGSWWGRVFYYELCNKNTGEPMVVVCTDIIGISCLGTRAKDLNIEILTASQLRDSYSYMLLKLED